LGRWIVTLTAAAALVVVPSALPKGASARNVARSFTLGTGAVKSVTVRCPRGWVAASGGIRSAGDGTATLAIRPAGGQAVSVRLANRAGNPPQRATVAASCLGLPGGRSAPYYKASHVQRKISVAGAAQKQAGLRCPAGTVAAGAGFAVSSPTLQVRQSTSTLNRFSFTVENVSVRARAAVLYGTCLTLVRPPGARSLRLNVRVITTTTPLPPGDRVVNEACPRGWFGLATGYSLSASVKLAGSIASPGGGRWSLTNPASKPLLADLQLTCARVA
jgi:hypothetical protein